MKNAIIAIIVALTVIGSAAASPVVSVIGVANAAKTAIGVTTDKAVQIADRKNNDYTPNISSVPAADRTQINDEDYKASVTMTDYKNGYVGETPIYKEIVKNDKVVNILCMYCDPIGMIDEDELDASAIITLDFDKNRVFATTVNNNLYVPIEGHDWNRLGAAIEYGGVGMYINTLNAVFDLDIQNYVIIDLSHIDEFVDWAGGIDFKLDKAAVEHFQGKYNYHIGTNHLDGAQTVDLFKAVKNKEITVSDEMAGSMSGILESLTDKFQNTNDISGLVKTVRNILKTNMDLLKLVDIAFNIIPIVKNAEDFKAEEITKNVSKAIVTVKETGKQIAVMIMDSIEQVRYEIQSKIYG